MDGNSILGESFNINAHNVTIRGFRITGYNIGIRMIGNDHKIIGCQIVFNKSIGISFDGK